MIVGLIACGNNSGGSSSAAGGSILASMPSSMKTFVYINPKGIKQIEMVGQLWDTMIPKEQADLLNKIDELYFATEAIEEDVIGMGMMDPMSLANEMNFIAVLKGNLKKDELKKTLAEEMNMTKEVKFDNIEGLQGNDGTVIFVDDKTVLITSTNFAQKAVNSFVKGQDRIDKNSAEFKAANGMKSNAMWTVLNLKEMGKVNLSNQTGGMLQGETTFGITTIGISTGNKTLTLDLTTNLDSNDVAKNISETLNATIQMFKGMVSGQLSQMGLSQNVTKDIEDIMNKTKVTANGSNVSTKVAIKESTLQELSVLAGGLLGGMMGGGF
jgi:hypothetical protein